MGFLEVEGLAGILLYMNYGRLTVPTGITQCIKAQTQWTVISYSPNGIE